jgi:hypothetical protein
MSSSESKKEGNCPSGYVLVPKGAVKDAYFDAPPTISMKDEKKDSKESKCEGDQMKLLTGMRRVMSAAIGVSGKRGEIATEIAAASYFTTSSSSAVSIGLVCAAYGCAEFANFASLYDEYVIDMVDIFVSFRSQIFATNGNEKVTWADCIDYNQNSTITSQSDMMDYTGSRYIPLGTQNCVAHRSWKPVGHYHVSSTEYATGWQPTSAAGNYYYGQYNFCPYSAPPVATQLPYTVRFQLRFRTRKV